MNLLLRRTEYGTNYTVGKLFVSDVYECFTLEDVVRAPGVKVQNATAIPAGTYNVIIDYSPHFGKSLPHIMDVPQFSEIRIHWGNTDLNTDGCLLVGTTWAGGDFIGNSVVAFNHLSPQIEAAIKAGEKVTIIIQDTK